VPSHMEKVTKTGGTVFAKYSELFLVAIFGTFHYCQL